MDQFLMVVANLLVTATTGVMGSLIGRGFTAAIDKQYAGTAKEVIRQHEASLTKRMSSGARKKMMAALSEGTSMQRSLQASLAKDLTMSLLTKGRTLGIAATPKPTSAPRESSHAITLRDYFIQTSKNAVLATKIQALHQLNDLSVDLAQLDIDILAPLAESMRGLGEATYDAMYDEALRQWQNTKARAASPARRSNFAPLQQEVDLAGAAKARGEAPVPGVVEAGLYAGRDTRTTKVDYLVLRDGEDAAVSHLQKHPRALGELDMNLMYQINFTPDAFLNRRADNHEHAYVPGVAIGTFVKFGVRRGGKVQASSFTSHELDVMRMFVANLDPAAFPANLVLSKASPQHRYKHVSDADAIAAALAIVGAVAHLTTRDLKKG